MIDLRLLARCLSSVVCEHVMFHGTLYVVIISILECMCQTVSNWYLSLDRAEI